MDAFKNVSLKSMRGERWKDIPGYIDLYQISSYGRVKSLPRLIELPSPRARGTISYWTVEKIRKIKVHKRLNRFTGENSFECTVSLFNGSGRETTFIIHRLVYQAFVAPIDFDSDGKMVVHIDDNGLNNSFKNLKISCRTQILKKAYSLKRHISPFALKSEKEWKVIARKSSIARQKSVCQCNARGKRLKIYPSIQHASRYLGIPDSNIVEALKGRRKTAGGFYWTYHLTGRKKT